MPLRRYPVKTVVDPSIGQVLNTMCKLAWEGRVNPAVRHRAVELTRNVESGKYSHEAKAILDDNMPPLYRYVKDPVGNEYLQGLDEQEQMKAGDCDDLTIRICAYLMALGHDMSIVPVSFRRGAPPTHVFARMETPDGPMVLDPVAGPNTARMLGNVRAYAVVRVERGVDSELRGDILDAPFGGWGGWPQK